MSIGIRKTFNLDMVPGGAPPVIHVSAGDVGRPFRANLLYSGETYGLDAVTSVKIRGTKPDKTVFEYDLTFDTEDSHVDFIIEEQMAIIAGPVLCEIRLFSGEDTIGSANFILDVETAVYDPEAASESYIPSFETAIQEALENVADDIADLATAAAINDVKQYADDAEAWATGSVDGTDVTSTADQYHNNAKYYAEQAGDKATAAAGSAADAANSAAQAMSTTPTGYNALVNTVNRNSLITHATLSLNTSVNTMITTGLWYCGQWADTPANVAKSGYLAVIEAFADSVGAYVKQLYSPYADSEIWFRTRNAGTWADWKKAPTRAEFDALNSKRTDTVNLANCSTIEEVVNTMTGKYLGYAKVGNGDSSNFKTLVGNVVSGSYYSAYVNWVNDAIVAENGYVLRVTAVPNIGDTNDYGVYVKYLYRHGTRNTYGQTVWVNVAKMT